MFDRPLHCLLLPTLEHLLDPQCHRPLVPVPEEHPEHDCHHSVVGEYQDVLVTFHVVHKTQGY